VDGALDVKIEQESRSWRGGFAVGSGITFPQGEAVVGLAGVERGDGLWF